MAAQCTRRAAKSYSCGIHFFEDSKNYPGENYVFFTLTRETARKIFWKSVLKTIDSKFKLGCKFNEARLECTTPWGATITLIGIDSDEKQKEKVLGQKLRWAYGDESAFFNIDLEEMVYDMLLPALADLNGGVTLTSTTSNRVNCFFHKITTGEIGGWNVHKWSYLDNPYTAKQVQRIIDKNIADRPGIENTPGFKQMYLNQWVIDLDALVYKFTRDKNIVYQYDSRRAKHGVIGIDLGFNDKSAFGVMGYDNEDGKLYCIESFGKSKLDISGVANEIRRLQAKYPNYRLVVDGANKQAVQEIINRHNIPLFTAEKIQKFEFIQIMNSDFLTGNIKILHDSCADYVAELEELVWDERKLPEKHVELSSKDNHCCFVAGTKISTINGFKNIECINLYDSVLTRRGENRVVSLFKREENIFKIKFSNGMELLSTKDHPVFTANRGFVPVDKLTKEDICLVKKEKSLFSIILSGIAIQILNAIVTGFILKERLVTKLLDYIGMSSSRLTVKFQEAITSITSMKIPQIIQSKILSLSREMSIFQNIWTRKKERINRENPLNSQSRKLQNGTLQKKVVNGIKTMAKYLKKVLHLEKKQRKESVLNVEKNTLSISFQRLLKIIVALQNVSQKKEGNQDLMILRENVRFVKKHSWLISMLNGLAVVFPVQQATDTKKKEMVYNIEVENEHEYFANGILVSNCDANLYAWRHCYNYIIKNKPEVLSDKQQVDRFWQKEQAKLEREKRINSSF